MVGVHKARFTDLPSRVLISHGVMFIRLDYQNTVSVNFRFHRRLVTSGHVV